MSKWVGNKRQKTQHIEKSVPQYLVELSIYSFRAFRIMFYRIVAAHSKVEITPGFIISLSRFLVNDELVVSVDRLCLIISNFAFRDIGNLVLEEMALLNGCY